MCVLSGLPEVSVCANAFFLKGITREKVRSFTHLYIAHFRIYVFVQPRRVWFFFFFFRSEITRIMWITSTVNFISMHAASLNQPTM